MYLPIDENSLMWTQAPIDNTTTDDLVQMVSKELVDKTYVISYVEVEVEVE
jgi:hypothetical protein